MAEEQPATKKAAAKRTAPRKVPVEKVVPAPAELNPPVEPGPVEPGPEESSSSTERGTTSIADQVVLKIAGIAAHDVPGVHALGGSTARAVGALRDRIPGTTTHHAQSQGISVEVGDTQAAVDLQMVADYGVPIVQVAAALRSAVISAVEEMTGLEVTEVNIEVQDVHLADDDSEEG